MREIKNEIAMVHPNPVFLVSKSNAGKLTYDSIDTLGKRLSLEVEDFLENTPDDGSDEKNITRISFIGHSLGGVIIRSALPRLEKYKNLFYTYCSLSSPHLGYSFHKSTLITSGMSMIQWFTDCTSLLQLQMKDYDDPK